MPDSGYSLAQRLQNTKKTPNTSKIYPVLNKLVKAGYLKKENGKYVHNVKTLVEDIKWVLESSNFPLIDAEVKILRNILANTTFFTILSSDIIQQMQNRPKGEHEINALQVICNKIGMLACIHQYHTQNKSEFDTVSKLQSVSNTNMGKSFEKVSEELKEFSNEVIKKMDHTIKGSKSVKQSKLNAIELIGNTLVSMILIGNVFEKIPNDTLRKFTLLWDQYNGFQLGMLISYSSNNKIDFSNYKTILDKFNYLQLNKLTYNSVNNNSFKINSELN
jgi:hypothetical protein